MFRGFAEMCEVEQCFVFVSTSSVRGIFWRRIEGEVPLQSVSRSYQNGFEEINLNVRGGRQHICWMWGFASIFRLTKSLFTEVI